MGHRHLLTIDRVGDPGLHALGREVSDDLMAEKIEVDPMLRAPSLGAAEQVAIEAARGGEIVDREGEVERRKRHARWIASKRRFSQ